MPVPKPKAGEQKPDWMGRCVPWMMTNDNMPNDQAVAACLRIWDEPPPQKADDVITCRAYSTFEIKSFVEEERVLEGIASTPSPDRMDDIVEPLGAQFSLPMPLLWQHDSHEPVGFVEHVEVTDKGITFRARLAKVDVPGRLKDRLDEAWQSVKAQLVRGVSIGFKALERSSMKNGGIRFLKWNWLELSLVTIPANAEATIQTIRSLDVAARAASGIARNVVSSRPASRGHSPDRRKGPAMAKRTLAEQISAFETKRAANDARRNEIMEQAAEEEVTLSEEQKGEYDELDQEIKEIDEHLVRLRRLAEVNARSAAPVEGSTSANGSDSRGGVVTVRGPNLPPGTAFTRYVIALARACGNLPQAAEISRQWKDTPQVELVLRAAVAAGTTTDPAWAAPLADYQNMASEFIEFLRPMTILGKIPGLRRVPFNIKMPRQTAGSSVGWVGEGKPKPVSKLAFDTLTLRFTKAAGIVVLTEELVRFSNPSAEAVVRQDLADSMQQFLDEQLMNPAIAAVVNTSPASITNGAANAPATGFTADDAINDIKKAYAHFAVNKIPISGSVWIMEPEQAVGLAMMRNPFGQPEFPGLTPTGGLLYNLPVVLSESAGNGQITLVKASEILLADDGTVTIDASREASLQLDTAPATGAQAQVSLWQNNMIALRAERYINWERRRDQAVYYITGANYGHVQSA